MQQRNLIAFFVVAMTVLVGWHYFEKWMWPPKPREPKRPNIQLPYAPLWANLPAGAAGNAAIPGTGLASAVQLVTDVGTLSNRLASDPPKSAVAEKPEPPRKAIVRKKSEQVPIGNDDFNVKAHLTTRGAGVQSLTLLAFEEANWFGRAVEPRRPLELIPNDALSPSNRLYHYADPNQNRPDRPEGDLGELEWDIQSVQTGADRPIHEVVFTCDVPNQDVRLTKTYTLGRGDYHLGHSIRMEKKGDDGKPTRFRYQLAGAHGLPIEGVWYTTVFRNALIGLEGSNKEIWRDLQTNQKIGFQSGGREVMRTDDKFVRYAGVATQYFASMIVVDDVQEKGVRQNFIAWARPTLEGESNPTKQFLDDITVRVISEPVELKPGTPVVHNYLLYNGPVKVALLSHLDGGHAVRNELVARYTDTLHLNTLTDYGSFGFWTSLIVFFTNVMHKLLWVIHTYVMPWSYGITIILLTVVVRGFLFPLSRRQAASTVKMQEKMQRLNQELAPEMKKLEEKYKNDPWQLRQAKHELYQKAGVNPFAMLSSCWLMLAQLPIFLGLYYALQESINFRLQSFLWMPNLAAPDMLFWWTEKIPFISDPAYLGSFFYLGPYFNLLPIIWVALMLWQQKVMTPPAADEQQAMQQKMMKYMMIPFFFFFYKVPAGLCIYWIGSICWSLGERKLLPKKQDTGTATPSADGKRLTPPAAARSKTKSDKAGARNENGARQKVSDWWQEVLKQARKK
jgi:YidC/Oxa1 family membrane protein insertase